MHYFQGSREHRPLLGGGGGHFKIRSIFNERNAILFGEIIICNPSLYTMDLTV